MLQEDSAQPDSSLAAIPAVSKNLLLLSVCSFQGTGERNHLRPGPQKCAVKLLDMYLLQLIIYDYK